MKPFTLAWWLDMYCRFVTKSSAYLMLYNKGFGENKNLHKLATKYAEKAEWVQKRIINKYGEQ